MKLFYDLWYRNYGIRKIAQFANPRLIPIEYLNLPRGAVLHVMNPDAGDPGLQVGDPILKNVRKVIWTQWVNELAVMEGSLRKVPQPINQLVKDYHRKNRQMRITAKMDVALSDPLSLIQVNYTLIPLLYRYQNNIYTDIHRWSNILRTMLLKINEMAAHPTRQHFYVFRVPALFPSLAEFKSCQGSDLNARLTQVFDSYSKFFMLELFRWFENFRSKSALGLIEAKNFARINFIFEQDSHWCCMNLGQLDEWRKSTKEEIAQGINTNDGKDGLGADRMAKMYLAMNLALHTATLVKDDEVSPDELPAQDEIDSDGEDVQFDAGEEDEGDERVDEPNLDAPEFEVQGSEGVSFDPDQVQEMGPGALDKADTRRDARLTAKTAKKLDKELARHERIADALQSKKDLAVATQELKDPGTAAQSIDPLNPPETVAKPSHVKDPSYRPPLVEAAPDVTHYIDKDAMELVEAGSITPAQASRIKALSKKWENIKAPDGTSMKDYIQIPPEMTHVASHLPAKDQDSIFAKGMLKSSLNHMDKTYSRKVLERDVLGMIVNTQKAGICITDIRKESVASASGSKDIYALKIIPVEGKESTIRVAIPTLGDDGEFKAGGTQYRFKKQRGDLPIRKIPVNTVALTSYYGKVFVHWDPRVSHSRMQKIASFISAASLEPHPVIKNVKTGMVFDQSFKAPRLYSSLAKSFRSFDISYQFYPADAQEPKRSSVSLQFNHKLGEVSFGKDVLDRLQKNGSVVVGQDLAGRYVTMTIDEHLMAHDDQNGVEDLGHFDDLIECKVMPQEYIVVDIYGKLIPLGVILGYQMGLSKLIEFLGIPVRRVPTGTRSKVESSEWSMSFADEHLIFPRKYAFASSILGGYTFFSKALKGFSVFEFDESWVYQNTLESARIPARHLKEVSMMDRLFIDPITMEILKERGEPQTFQGLLLRAAELLQDETYPDELDSHYMRIKGNERIAGMVYGEMIKSVRAHSYKPIKANSSVEMNPYAVWYGVLSDPSKQLIDEINPIQNLKEGEAITFIGQGGRSKQTMVATSRQFQPSDAGVISELTTDSGDVGINVYSSANPLFNSVRGTSTPYDLKEADPTSLFSTSALLSPGCDTDDPKRVNFIGIQQAHAVACSGYRISQIRTGYEQVLASRVGDTFAKIAENDGVVTSVTETGITVKYSDGTEAGYKLGRHFGAAAGMIIPHEIITSLKTGDKFKMGDVLSYNPGFFSPDPLNPKNIAWMSGVPAYVAMMESDDTIEDACLITQDLSDKLKTSIADKRVAFLGFEQSIRNLVGIGQEITSDEVLFTIEDEVTARSDLLSDVNQDTLKLLAARSPTADSKGVVESIEIYYHGDIEDMSPSLAKAVKDSDKRMIARCKSQGKPVHDGSVDDEFRVDGESLTIDTAVIIIHITSSVGAKDGDKGVVAHQLKTTITGVLDEAPVSEDGTIIDATFSMKGAYNRVVVSAPTMGVAQILLDQIAKRSVSMYFD